MLKDFSWCVILLDRTCLMISWLSSYNFYGLPIVYPIDPQKFLIQSWSTIPLYIAIVSGLKLLWKVLVCFLEHQSIMAPLERWEVDVTERLTVISLAWSAPQYEWINFEYCCVWLISALPDLKKHLRGISFALKILFLEYMICSCGWHMWYSMPWRRARNSGSVGAFMYPLSSIVIYWRSHRVWTVIFMRNPTQWLSDPPCIISSISIRLQWVVWLWKDISKWFICWKRWFLKLDIIFCLCSPLLLNNVIDDMVCIINTDAIFTMDTGDTEDLELGTFL